MIASFFKGLSLSLIPPWARWLILVCSWVVVGVLCFVQGIDHGNATHTQYVQKQATETVRIVQAQAQVITKIETVYRDRIQVIYREGAKIETQIPDYIKPVDEHKFAVNAGFLRIVNAAWSGDAPGPAEDADREPAGIPLGDIAAVQTGNITSCRAWRAQALGWRDFYAEQQIAVNGRAGAWYSGAERLQDNSPVTAPKGADTGEKHE